jgi:hypothetical protein
MDGVVRPPSSDGDHLCLSPFHHCDARVGGAEVNADDSLAFLVIFFSFFFFALCNFDTRRAE